MSNSPNPYRPPEVIDPVPRDLADGFAFRLTRQNLRHGQSHHLIRCKPFGVTIVSVIMIAVSLVVFSYFVAQFGPRYALGIMPLLLGGSAFAYITVISEPKRLTQARMSQCGLVPGAMVQVMGDDDQVTASVDDGQHTITWQKDNIKRYRTPRGLMIVPEQYVFLFLPSRGQFDRVTYRSILEMFPKA